MKAWRPALRMARRDLRRHPVRALLTSLLVALPVLAATIAGLVASNNQAWDGERAAIATMGAADGTLVVSKFSAIKPRSVLIGGDPRPVSNAVKRPRAQVDLASLLPAGSRWIPAVAYDYRTLSTGGQISLTQADLRDPLTASVAVLDRGRVPTEAGETAVPTSVAKLLGMLDPDGSVRTGQTLGLADGTTLQVVGTVRWGDRGGDQLSAVVAPGTVNAIPGHYLVDLPKLDRSQTKDLVASLAEAGVGLQPRDSILHPRAWRLPDDGSSFDPAPFLIGALIILVGLVEVVLLVGAAFSVAARRHVRDLGLVAMNGGTGKDLRRVLLAQGLVLGVVASMVGAAAGVLLFRFGSEAVERRLDSFLWRHEISWTLVAAMVALGSVTAVIAAMLPAWNASRLTPVQALSGRFPVKAGESRAHRPAFVLAGGGLALLVLGGGLVAWSQHAHEQWIGVAFFLAAIGLLVAIAGMAWSTPYAVRRASELGNGLPLAGRYAFRDAGRHRFRTAAAVIALSIAVCGAVLTGFGFKSALRQQAYHGDQSSPTALTVNVDSDGRSGVDAPAVVATVRKLVDPVSVAATYGLQPVKHPGAWVSAGNPGRRGELQVADRDSLARLVRVDDAVLAAYDRGAVLTTSRVTGDTVVVRAQGARRQVPDQTVPAVRVRSADGGRAWTLISPEKAAGLGFKPTWGMLIAQLDHTVTQDDLDVLGAYGLNAWSNGPEHAWLVRLQYAGLIAAAGLTLLVVGMAVALAAAESRDDVATLAAVGADGWTRRRFGAMHGLFLGLVATALGLVVGVPAGLAFTQIDGLPGVDMAWGSTLAVVPVVLLAAMAIGAIVTPSRFTLTRRAA
ncbi:MAG: hypothetical protein QM655_02925 [Nocardioidaceae bacterium]